MLLKVAHLNPLLYIGNHGLDIDAVLSEDELSLVNAVLSTKSLIELKKLLNENTQIVKSIVEQYVLTKRKKHDDE